MRFRIEPQSPEPVFEQLVHQVKLEIALGRIQPDERLPTVRELASALLINPNTVQKAINVLKQEGLVEIVPGIGTRVCAAPKATRAERAQMLGEELEHLVIRAKQLALEPDDIVAALHRHWRSL